MKAYDSPYSAQETVATISRCSSVARNESGSAARKRSASSSPGFQPSASAHEIATWAARLTSISLGEDATEPSTPLPIPFLPGTPGRRLRSPQNEPGPPALDTRRCLSRPVHDPARPHDRECGAALDPAGTGRDVGHPRLDDQRLHAVACLVHPGRRHTRRS